MHEHNLSPLLPYQCCAVQIMTHIVSGGGLYFEGFVLHTLSLQEIEAVKQKESQVMIVFVYLQHLKQCPSAITGGRPMCTSNRWNSTGPT